MQIAEGASTWDSVLLIPNGRFLLRRPEFLPASIYSSFRDAEKEENMHFNCVLGKYSVTLGSFVPQNAEEDYQLWFSASQEEAPGPLLGKHLRNISRH